MKYSIQPCSAMSSNRACSSWCDVVLDAMSHSPCGWMPQCDMSLCHWGIHPRNTIPRTTELGWGDMVLLMWIASETFTFTIKPCLFCALFPRMSGFSKVAILEMFLEHQDFAVRLSEPTLYGSISVFPSLCTVFFSCRDSTGSRQAQCCAQLFDHTLHL